MTGPRTGAGKQAAKTSAFSRLPAEAKEVHALLGAPGLPCLGEARWVPYEMIVLARGEQHRRETRDLLAKLEAGGFVAQGTGEWAGAWRAT